MGIKISELGVVVPGSITRKFDSGANETTLTLSEAQARSIHESLGGAIAFFDTQAGMEADIADLRVVAGKSVQVPHE